MPVQNNLNFLVIMCDQLRYDALSCNGNSEIETPNIDRLAEKSIRFRCAYNQSPLCGPTRHSLATGLYPYQHGVLNNVLLPFEGMYTIAHALGEANYRRYCFGHMHWQRIPGESKEEFMDSGYEEYLGRGISELSSMKEEFRRWEKVSKTQMYTSGPSILDTEEFNGYSVLRDSVKMLEEWTKNGDKFLSWTSFHEPHPPFFPPLEYYREIEHESLSLPKEIPPDAPAPHPSVGSGDPRWKLFTDYEKRRMKAGYYGLVKMVDDFIGELLDTLDRLELWSNTMIIFTVDHGEQMGDHGRYSKGVMREPSVHIPFMVYHPDYEPGSRGQLVEHVDVFPTISDFAGVQVPDTIEGRSLRPLLEKDQTPESWREFVFSQLNRTIMIRNHRWKMNIYDKKPEELYDMENDPDEFNNLLADGSGSCEYRGIAEDLQKKMLEKQPDVFEKAEQILHSGRHRKNKMKPRIMKVKVR